MASQFEEYGNGTEGGEAILCVRWERSMCAYFYMQQLIKDVRWTEWLATNR